MISIFTYRTESYKNVGEALASGGVYLIDGIETVDGCSSFTVVDTLVVIEHTANTLGHDIGFGFVDGNKYLDLGDGDARAIAWAGFECPSELFGMTDLQKHIYVEEKPSD